MNHHCSDPDANCQRPSCAEWACSFRVILRVVLSDILEVLQASENIVTVVLVIRGSLLIYVFAGW
jgi:hypothetical protein